VINLPNYNGIVHQGWAKVLLSSVFREGGHRWQGLLTNPQAKLGDLLVDSISLVEGDISGLRLMSWTEALGSPPGCITCQ
jgi:hypothetical protein